MPHEQVTVSHQELKEKVQEILRGTPKRVIKDLSALLKGYQTDKSLTFGKGSHKKLYINGELIVIPKHRNLKQGTAHSIQNSIVNALEKSVK